MTLYGVGLYAHGSRPVRQV